MEIPDVGNYTTTTPKVMGWEACANLYGQSKSKLSPAFCYTSLVRFAEQSQGLNVVFIYVNQFLTHDIIVFICIYVCMSSTVI